MLHCKNGTLRQSYNQISFKRNKTSLCALLEKENETRRKRRRNETRNTQENRELTSVRNIDH